MVEITWFRDIVINLDQAIARAGLCARTGSTLTENFVHKSTSSTLSNIFYIAFITAARRTDLNEQPVSREESVDDYSFSLFLF